MKKAKTVSIVGSPGSGKSTLASQINSLLKTSGINSVFIEEYVTEFIGEFGIPYKMEHQQVIFDKQYDKERMFSQNKDFVVCDSASWLSYIYGRQYYDSPLEKQDIATLNHLHKKALESLEYWDFVFYLPTPETYGLDGVRYHTQEESNKLDKMIKGWLEIENVQYIDLSHIEVGKRIDEVMKRIGVSTFK
ncbi:thymidylate kinase [Bacillus phage G]|uniref:Gp293 n=1 Tax=Bacillus phage G TaxID=2884420 RepID=G3MA34_9CAUD|nr:thymidylate kinase [Bacillus phage G]AEO93552.1 gp293 [Bacillus phage G]